MFEESTGGQGPEWGGCKFAFREGGCKYLPYDQLFFCFHSTHGAVYKGRCKEGGGFFWICNHLQRGGGADSHRIVSSLTIFFQNSRKDDVYLLCSETKRKHWKRKQSPAIRKYLNNHATSCITCNALFKQSKQGILTKVNFNWRPLDRGWSAIRPFKLDPPLNFGWISIHTRLLSLSWL